MDNTTLYIIGLIISSAFFILFGIIKATIQDVDALLYVFTNGGRDNPSSSIFDLTQTQVLNNKFCRVLSWYDNEWGFSNRMIETMINLKKYI